MENSMLLLFVVVFVVFIFGTILLQRFFRNMTNTYTKAKRIVIIYVSILLISMVVDEVFLKNKREVLVEANVKESFETLDRLYMGNRENIKKKYIHNEWLFPYTNQKLLINEFNSLQIMIERVANLEEIKATMYYDQIIDDYDTRYTEPFIALNLVGEELFVTTKAKNKMFHRVMNTSVLNNFPSQKARESNMWGGDNSFAILYLQVPKDVAIEVNEDARIEYLEGLEHIIRE